MNDITLNITDCLSSEELKEICEDEFRRYLREKLRERDVTSWLSTLSYKTVWRIVDEYFKTLDVRSDLEILLCQKIIAIINELSAFSVFRRKEDGYASYDSAGQILLDKIVEENEPLIRKRVEEIIADYPFREVKEDINDTIYDVIKKRFLWKEGNDETD